MVFFFSLDSERVLRKTKRSKDLLFKCVFFSLFLHVFLPPAFLINFKEEDTQKKALLSLKEKAVFRR